MWLRGVGVGALALVWMTPLWAQHGDHEGEATKHQEQPEAAHAVGPAGIPMQRTGSGTAWQPDLSPMYGRHLRAGAWSPMVHGSVFLQYVDAGGRRGDEQLGATTWFMGMAKRRFAGGELGVRGMFSLDPLTVGTCGYPLLLATGETCEGEALHDRQHPHDLLMEITAEYARELAPGLALTLYGGPAAEPALGPVAFPHRLSALANPLAPIGHHWQDATHIAFGVVTAGVFGRAWKLEGSVFNGREPDEARYDLDLNGLDSYSGRIWWLPSERVAFQVSLGHLEEAEVDVDVGGRRDVDRTTASLTYHHPVSRGGLWATTLVWGRNREQDERTHSALVETSLNLQEQHLFFARGEIVQKPAGDLDVSDAGGFTVDRRFTVGSGSLGYMRQIGIGGLVGGIGARAGLAFVPDALESFYGSQPFGFVVFAHLRPAPMRMDVMSRQDRPEHEARGRSPARPHH
ncbi:MAG: hypothetical protein HY561_00840 [Gemmatimonadetes bacterium]|nr:hypothetical protein [Gemmatimonadota bacterium]